MNRLEYGFSHSMKMLSTEKLYAIFSGSPTLLQQAMVRCGQPAPHVNAISMWRIRGSIPSHWAGAVIHTVMQHGIDVSVLLSDLDVTVAS